MEKDNRLYWLITGGTGLVGQYLLRDLTLADQKLAVVVRDGRREQAAMRVERIMQMWEAEVGRSLPRPVVLTGDVSQPGLGLHEDQREWVRRHCSRFVHNAATLTFHPTSDGEPFRTNVGGTKHVMDLAQFAQPDQFHYVSTAYVCGKREGVIREDEFDCGQEFRNAYEESKFEAERIVRETAGPWTTTIYRPAVIGGDSTTGYTATYHGIFMYLRLLATLVPQQQRDENGVIQTPIHLPMTGDEPRNLVPVEWVTKVMTRILLDSATHGRTYHLVPDQPITPRRLIDACCKYFNSDGVVYCGPNAPRSAENDFAARYFENAQAYEDYEQCDPTFDCRNLKEVAGDIPCPEITEDVVLRYMEFGVQDRWGKRKPRSIDSPRIGERVAEALQKSAAHLSQQSDGGKPIAQCAGVVIAGPGGGDFMLDLRNGDLRRGVGCQSPVIRLDARKLALLCKDDGAEREDLATDGRDQEADDTVSLEEVVLNVVSTLYSGNVMNESSRVGPTSDALEPRGDMPA